MGATAPVFPDGLRRITSETAGALEPRSGPRGRAAVRSDMPHDVPRVGLGEPGARIVYLSGSGDRCPVWRSVVGTARGRAGSRFPIATGPICSTSSRPRTPAGVRLPAPPLLTIVGH